MRVSDKKPAHFENTKNLFTGASDILVTIMITKQQQSGYWRNTKDPHIKNNNHTCTVSRLTNTQNIYEYNNCKYQ